MVVISLVTCFLLFLMAWSQSRSRLESATAAIVDGRPGYYITDQTYHPDEALTACAEGYHFASLWEIIGPSNLTYNTSLGQTTLDSGGGPPTIMGLGWVRTGYNFADVTNTAGHANCALWSTRDPGAFGSVAVLPQLWTAGTQDLFVWDVDVRTCNFKLGVWCKQDRPRYTYLPVILGP